MTSDITILNMTANGIVSKKQYFNEYLIIFKNLNFTFSLKAYDEFTKYIIALKNIFEEHRENSSCTCKEIEIPTGNTALTLTVNYDELLELNDLFSLKKLKINVINRMNYNFSLN
jgi:hypothetical protein